MYRLSVALWIAEFLSGSVSSDPAYAGPGCECPPMQLITLGSTDQWRGVLADFPNESLDVSVPMDAAFLEQFGPDATLSLKMSSIATRCEVDSESVRVGDLTGRIGDDDHG